MSRQADRCPACKRMPSPIYGDAQNGTKVEVFKCDVCKKEGCERCMDINSAEFICRKCKRSKPRGK